MAHTWRLAAVGPSKLVAITICKERVPGKEWRNYKGECGRMQDGNNQSYEITKIANVLVYCVKT